jgi:hypothetical protein
MVDAVQIFSPGYRVTDNSTGAPVSGAKIKFFNAGTSTPKTVYSDSGLSSSLGSVVYCDSLGTPVASEGSSTAVMVYTGTAAYKCTITTSADVTIKSLDNIKGALDTSTFLTTGSTSTLTQPVVTKTGDYTVVAADRSKLIECNTTGGQFTLTLTAAATLGDNFSVKIRNSGTANQFILAASQNIAFEGQTFTARAFKIGEGAEIICDGTGFKIVGHTPPLMSSQNPAVITIADRVTADPGSPTAGARYIVATGYGSYSTGDIIESNGSSFNKYTPPANCGWIAYVQDEFLYYRYIDNLWRVETATDTTSGTVELASQAEMEAGTSVSFVAVTPGRQKYHPGHPKAGGNFDGSGTPAFRSGDYGMGAITDGGTGIYTLALDTAFSGTEYWAAAWSREAAVGSDLSVCSAFSAATKTTSAFQTHVGNPETNSLHDSTETGISLWGDYA